MLQSFLDKKPLYYTEIDYTRMPRVYEKIKSHMCPSKATNTLGVPKAKIIHLVGTNGKGTTGRFLATALFNIGYKTAHYTSPHILEFNERVWLNGENVSDETLDIAHEILQTILTHEDSNSLSYFEYTTLLAMLVFKECEYIILEAGLGGEYDATAVFDKTLTLVTPIDYDHEAFLGSNIEDIARTKINAIQKNAIISTQKYEKVYKIAKKIADEKKANFFSVDEFINDVDIDKISKISKKLSLALYLEDNLKLSISALKFLDIDYKINDFNNSKLFGRLSKISDNIIVDVGHNPLAASSILKALSPQKYILIYNTYKDKEYKKILEILKPIIFHVEIIDINDDRIESSKLLHLTLKELGIEYNSFNKIDKNMNYLVFGSFMVVEAFLDRYNG
ncbi:MAG: bifunctional folylpolyglutamate synthase/dihydrofolate synthase [Sulfurimonas sp.]|nr:bifunctional folylpolyglutamate synthase/dihydrofolate synthase [Sulfurimonas sp.]